MSKVLSLALQQKECNFVGALGGVRTLRTYLHLKGVTVKGTLAVREDELLVYHNDQMEWCTATLVDGKPG